MLELSFTNLAPKGTQRIGGPKLTMENAITRIYVLDICYKARNIHDDSLKISNALELADKEVLFWFFNYSEKPDTWRKFKTRQIKYIKKK